MKTGITVAVNGSQDDKINIKGLENYRVEEDDSSDDDPFSDSEPASSEDAEDHKMRLLKRKLVTPVLKRTKQVQKKKWTVS